MSWGASSNAVIIKSQCHLHHQCHHQHHNHQHGTLYPQFIVVECIMAVWTLAEPTKPLRIAQMYWRTWFKTWWLAIENASVKCCLMATIQAREHCKHLHVSVWLTWLNDGCKIVFWCCVCACINPTYNMCGLLQTSTSINIYIYMRRLCKAIAK